MISHKYKVIFVHIPRTAGHTISAAFEYKRNKHDKVKRHAKPIEYQHQYSKEWQSYFKFTFVRNPWERVLSAWYARSYRYLDQDIVREMFNSFIRNELLEKVQTKPQHFRSQIEWVTNSKGQLHPDYDYIAYVEKGVLDEINYIRHQVGLSPSHKERMLGSSSKQREFRFYYDQKSLEIVADVYREEIMLLGYQDFLTKI